MEWSIQQLARAAGTTSRTLRHYGELGLLVPSRVGGNGYRYYDAASLVTLQRILLLRELGLSLATIAEVLDGQRDPVTALRAHLGLLEQERERLARQIAAVRTTMDKTERGEPLMPDEAFDGFDHAQHRDEVIERWGRDAYERGDTWWRGLTGDERRAHRQAHDDIARDWGAAKRDGLAPASDAAQAIAARHVAWLSATTTPTAAYVRGLGEMYVADERFGRNYDGAAELVRDALAVYAEREL